jgi:cell division protein ZapA
VAANTTKVQILDKDYLIACPEEERPGLHQSASYLDEKMREIRASGKIHGLERIAVMAALNIAHEFLQKDIANSSSKSIALRLASKVDEVLQELS